MYIDANTPASWSWKKSKYSYPAAGHVITGNLKIISESWIRSKFCKGPKYSFPSHIDFKKYRKGIAAALNDFGNRCGKREYVEPSTLKNWKLSTIKINSKCIEFYSQNTNLLPCKPKSSFPQLKQGIQEYHRKYVLVPADKDANNVIVVWRLHYINTLKQELGETKAYNLQNSADEQSVHFDHCCHTATKFAVSIKEDHERFPTIYWLPKLHKRQYKARFIANSSSSTTTKLSKLLTSCLTAIKKHLIKYYEKVYKRSGKNLFWFIKNFGTSVRYWINKTSRGFRTASLSAYDLSTLYTTLPHNLIKETLIDLTERTF